MTGPIDAESAGNPAAESLQDYVSALRMLRAVRTLFFIILLVTMLFPLAAFALARCGLVTAESAAQATSTPAAPEVPAAQSRLHRATLAGLAVAEVFARGAALLLLIVYLLTINVCLVGRLGSGHDVMVAFFWMVVVLLLLGAWTVALLGPGAPRIFYSLHELLAAESALQPGWGAAGLHYLTFLGLPALGALAAVIADVRFGRSYVQAMQRVRQRMGVSSDA